MPKHYAVGENVQTGTVYFNGTKTMTVWFSKPFTHKPSVTLTLGDVNNTPPYRTNIVTTKMEIKFKTAYLGNVNWVAMANGGA